MRKEHLTYEIMDLMEPVKRPDVPEETDTKAEYDPNSYPVNFNIRMTQVNASSSMTASLMTSTAEKIGYALSRLKCIRNLSPVYMSPVYMSRLKSGDSTLEIRVIRFGIVPGRMDCRHAIRLLNVFQNVTVDSGHTLLKKSFPNNVITPAAFAAYQYFSGISFRYTIDFVDGFSFTMTDIPSTLVNAWRALTAGSGSMSFPLVSEKETASNIINYCERLCSKGMYTKEKLTDVLNTMFGRHPSTYSLI